MKVVRGAGKGAAYIYIKDRIKKGQVKRTVSACGFVNMDFDKNDNLLGIEIISTTDPVSMKRSKKK